MGGQGETRETRAAHPRSRPEDPAPTAQGVLPSPAAGVQAARACRPPPGAERSGVSRGRVPGLALFAEGSPASAVYGEKTRPLRPGEPGRATRTPSWRRACGPKRASPPRGPGQTSLAPPGLAHLILPLPPARCLRLPRVHLPAAALGCKAVRVNSSSPQEFLCDS